MANDFYTNIDILLKNLPAKFNSMDGAREIE